MQTKSVDSLNWLGSSASSLPYPFRSTQVRVRHPNKLSDESRKDSVPGSGAERMIVAALPLVVGLILAQPVGFLRWPRGTDE